MHIGHLFLLLALLSFAAMGIFHKLADKYRCNPLHITMFCMLFALTVNLANVLIRTAPTTSFPTRIFWLAIPFGLCASAINTYYRDARHAMPFILQLIMYLSPVLYPLSIVPDQWQVPYALLNPLAGSIDGFREIVLHGGWPDATITAASLASSCVYFVLAYAAFKAVERGFTDRV
jgi:ABC-type polysaccharide/polyol phosphate export permease